MDMRCPAATESLAVPLPPTVDLQPCQPKFSKQSSAALDAFAFFTRCTTLGQSPLLQQSRTKHCFYASTRCPCPPSR
jgi:hypothetical protein